jgi:hypothetical protein
MKISSTDMRMSYKSLRIAKTPPNLVVSSFIDDLALSKQTYSYDSTLRRSSTAVLHWELARSQTLQELKSSERHLLSLIRPRAAD